MEERLLLLLESEHLSSSKFADEIGVQRSSVSHILSGRNKPSFDFMQKTLKAFPALNADWLILGEGDMYEGSVSSASDTLFQQLDQKSNTNKESSSHSGAQGNQNQADNPQNPANISSQSGIQPEKSQSQESDPGLRTRKVTRVILFYDDNSFHTYESDT